MAAGIELAPLITKIKVDLEDFKSQMSKAVTAGAGAAKEMSEKMSTVNKVGEGFTKTGKALTTYVSAPLAGFGAIAVKTAGDFEAGMSKVKAISGSTAEEMNQLRDKAIEMGAKTKFSAGESADAFQYMAMAGWDAEQMMDGISGIMSLAAADGLDLATTSDIVTDALTGFGLQAKDSGHFADVLAQASSSANTNVQMLGESFKYVAPVAGALGLSAEDTALALGLMANSGIKASQAGTSLRTALTNMISPTDQMAAAMDKYGISMTESDGTMKSLKQVMDELRQKLGGLSESEQAAAASTIFGKEAMSGMLAIINASDSDYQKLANSIANCDGRADEMASTMMDNLPGAIEQMKGAIETLAIKIGTLLIPTIRSIAEGIGNFVEKLNNMSDSQAQAAIKVAGFVAALGPALMVIGNLITWGVKMATTFSSISAAVSAAGGASAMFGSAITLLTGPVGIAIAACVAFAAAVATNFGGIRDTIVNIMGMISNTIQTILATIKTLWENDFMGIKTYTQACFDAIGVIVKTVMGVIEGIVKTFCSVLTGDWKGAWEGVKQIASSILDGIKSLIDIAFKAIVDIVLNISFSLLNAAKTSFAKITEGAKASWEALKTWINQVKEDPVGAIKSIGSSMLNAGKNIISSLWEGMKSIWSSLQKWLDDKVEWVKEKVQFWKSEKAKMNDDSDGSHFNGLSYVPFDGYNATLHKGERVLTAEENKAYNQGQLGGGGYNGPLMVIENFNNNTQEDIDSLMDRINNKLKRE